MSIGSILPGRIPLTLAASRLAANLQHDAQLLARLQDQISSGQKFFVPSESPAAAIRSIMVQKTIERKQQAQDNVSIDRSLLSATDSAMTSISTVLSRAKSFAIAGVGDSSSSSEKKAMAQETATLITQVLAAANTQFRGRYLFGGSESLTVPFEQIGDSTLRYNGDGHRIDSFIDLAMLLANNVDGKTAFGATTPPVGSDVDPALTLDTKIVNLHRGEGVQLDSIVVTLDDAAIPATVTQTVDLSNAETIGDIKTILEDAFSGSPITLDVSVDLASNFGLRLQPSSGTVAVSDAAGSTAATDLGIAGGAVATINGGDLDPRLTLLTPLSALNGAGGVAQVPGQGLLITSGDRTEVIDISDPSITTVEDLLNTLVLADLDLEVGINQAGDGLDISSRLSGVDFSIGENGGQAATDLGIRTFTGSTLLADLNLGLGVPVEVDGGGDAVNLEITRRDGATVLIDVSNMRTVEQVIDAIDTDSGLSASLNTVGNGITITDDTGGAGPLSVKADAASIALGIAGEVVDPADPLLGEDVNPLEAGGVLNILIALENALETGDDRELERLAALINDEAERITLVRGEVGSRLQLLEAVENRLADEEIVLQEALSEELDVDLTEVITQLASVQMTLEANLKAAASTMQLSLFTFL